MEKKNIAIIVLAVALIASGVGNIILAVRVNPTPSYTTLVYGTGAGPHTIDPVNCWDSASSDVILQTAEGLFGYDLSQWDMPRVPVLATGYYWQDETHLQVTLRQGVMFHDGAVWNSTSAKWNWDRNMLLTNASGALPVTSPLAEPASLYFFNMTYNDDGVMNGGTPIIQSVTAVGAWNITFVLNAPFAPFLDLLCFEASLMVSPKSTPADRFITLSEKLVGTGPFVFQSFTPNVDVRWTRNENYWRPQAGFHTLVFSIIADSVTRNNAFLTGQTDFCAGVLASLLPTYEADKNIFVWHITDDPNAFAGGPDHSVPGLAYYYLGFNNVLINTTMRKAISYAINYSYIIDQMQSGLVFRANSPISPGYGSAYNASVQAASYNLAYARAVIKDMVPGIVGSLVANNDTTGANADGWKALNIAAFNYTYNTETAFRVQLYAPLHSWMEQIGVDVVDNGITWDSFLDALYVHHDRLGLYWVGWGPDYLDPFNMLDPLFNPASTSDSAQVDDPTLNSLMHTALQTTDQVARDNIYKHIQYYLANVLYVHAFGYHGKLNAIHAADIYGVNYNAMGKVELYGVYRGPARPAYQTTYYA
jgi:peptide/nickel transport system substrate-binding protein